MQNCGEWQQYFVVPFSLNLSLLLTCWIHIYNVTRFCFFTHLPCKSFSRFFEFYFLNINSRLTFVVITGESKRSSPGFESHLWSLLVQPHSQDILKTVRYFGCCPVPSLNRVAELPCPAQSWSVEYYVLGLFQLWSHSIQGQFNSPITFSRSDLFSLSPSSTKGLRNSIFIQTIKYFKKIFALEKLIFTKYICVPWRKYF